MTMTQQLAANLLKLVADYQLGVISEEEFLNGVSTSGWGKAMSDFLNRKNAEKLNSERLYQEALSKQAKF